MWELRLIAVGQPKDRAVREGLDRYSEMVGGEWRLRMEFVKPSKRGIPEACRREEGSAIRSRIGEGCEAIALDPEGEAMSSARFARMLEGYKDRGRPVAFAVGGPHGLDRETLGACHRRLSLSPMTLTHELAALVLAEQVFRAYAACSARPYAK